MSLGVLHQWLHSTPIPQMEQSTWGRPTHLNPRVDSAFWLFQFKSSVSFLHSELLLYSQKKFISPSTCLIDGNKGMTKKHNTDYFALRKKLDMLFLATGASFGFSAFAFDTRGLLASISSSAKSSSKKRKFGVCLHTWISVVFYKEREMDTTHMNLFTMFTTHSLLYLGRKIIDE